MWAIFKPLFTYRKYLLANKVLDEASKSFAAITSYEFPKENLKVPAHQKGYMLQFTKYFLKAHKKVNPDRLHEALDLLKTNNHIELSQHQDIYQITYRATLLGDRANNDGFYMTQVYKSVALIYGSTAGILTLLITYLPKLIRYWMQ